MGKQDIDAARGVAEIEGRTQPSEKSEKSEKPVGKAGPAAGPHATDALTRNEATPGAGALPDTKRDAVDIDGGAG